MKVVSCVRRVIVYRWPLW